MPEGWGHRADHSVLLSRRMGRSRVGTIAPMVAATRGGAARCALRVLVATTLAWFVGWWGPRASLDGRGAAVLAPEVGEEAIWIIGLASAIWLIFAMVVERRPVLVHLSAVCFVAASAAATAANAGRLPGAASAIGVYVARAVFASWQPTAGWPPRRRRVAWLAVPPLMVAQVTWARGWGVLDQPLSHGPIGYVVALLVALGAVELHHRWPAVIARMEAPTVHFGEGARRVAGAGRERAVLASGALRTRAANIDPSATRHRFRTRTVTAMRWSAPGVLVAVVWLPAIWLLCDRLDAFTVLGINDYPLHLEVAERFTLIPFATEGPHLLFHAGTAVARSALPDHTAPVAVIGVAIAAMVWAAVALLRAPDAVGRRLSMGHSQVMAVAWAFMETPAIVLMLVGVVDLATPVATVHWWGNPTWMVALPFAIAFLPAFEASVERSVASGRLAVGPVAGASVLLAVGAVAKPSFALCAVPVIPVYLALVRRAPMRLVGVVTVAVAGPTVLVVGWQTWFLATSPASRFSTGWTFDPVVAPAFGWGSVRPVLLLPLLVVALAVVVDARGLLRDTSVSFVLSCLAVAIPIMLSINETGERASHGNFWVPTQVCVSLLVLLSLRHIARRFWIDERTIPRWKVIVVAAVGASFMAGGLVSWLTAADLISLQLTWEAQG
jgi:hypothetical protein